MPILILFPDGDSDGAAHGCDHLLGHLAKRWPASFVLAVGPRPPSEWTRFTQLDWVNLPADGIGFGSLDIGLLQTLIRRFEIGALIVAEPAPTEVLDALRGMLPIMALRDPSGDLPARRATDEQLKLDPNERWLEQLDRWLARTIPVELVAGPQRAIEDIARELDGHAASDRACELKLCWTGQADRQLGLLVRYLRGRPDLTGVGITVLLDAPNLFAVHRTGLTHAVTDFVSEPSFFFQFAEMARSVLGLPAGVRVEVRTASRRRWIHKSVGVFNSAVNLLRAGSGLLGKGRAD